MATLTQLAALRLEEIRSCELTVEVQKKAITCLLDYLGALVSGLSAPWSHALLRYARGTCATPGEAHVIGLDAPVSAETAAFANAAIAHSIIRDDMHLAAGAHIGVMVIPAALALAQRENWSGDNLLKAIVGGYEMAAALGSAVRFSGSCNPHFRPSGIIGAFAAAAVGIVGDDSISTTVAASALGLGANMASGLNEWPWAGGVEINTQMGTASRSGIASIDLARAGICSSETALEGRDGLFVAYGCGSECAKKFKEWLARSPLGAGILGAKFKPTAGCNFVQTPVSVALEISDKVGQSLQEVEKVSIVVTTAAKAYPGCDNLGPFDKVQQTKMSLQYSVSAALLFGHVDETTCQQFDDQDLQTIIQKCHIETNAVYDQALSEGRQPCRVEVAMRDGSQYQHHLPDVPWLEAGAVEERTRIEATLLFDQATIDNIVLECKNLQERKSCARLFDLLASHRSSKAIRARLS